MRKAVGAGLAAALMVAGVGAIAPEAAGAAVTPATGDNAGALAISQALASPQANITGASWSSITASGTPNGTSDGALADFPTDGSSFGVLTSGNVSSVPNPGTFASTSNGGAAVRGDTDRDVSILKTDFTAPGGANCLTFDFKFLSEEYPNFVGGSVNDAFVAELDTSNWTTASNVITAPNNFAFDGDGNVVSINSTGVGGMTEAGGAGTAFDGGDNLGAGTQVLHASRQVTPGAHSLYFSLFDQGDNVYDSAVFLDNLRVGFVPNPEVNCVGGATPVTASMDLTPATATNPVNTSHTVTATLVDGEGAAISGATIGFTVAGVNPTTGTGTTNGAGVATFTYTGTNAGDDQISACYNADSTGPCEAQASATKTWTGVVPVTHALTVNITGSGSVTSTPSGIACPGDCTNEYSEGASVALTPEPSSGFVFSGWSGACSGNAACNVTMSADQTVGATFTPVAVTRTLNVTVNGAGSVTSDPAGIACPESCSAPFADGASVTLTATADDGSTFTGWGGACAGTEGCSVTMNADQSVTAAFEAVVPPSGDLPVTEVSSPALVTAGNQVQQVFTVTNDSDGPQTGVTVGGAFPAGTTIQSITPSQGSCFSAGPSSILCDIGTIAGGGSATITAVVTVPAGFAPGTFAPTATSASDQTGTSDFSDLPGTQVVAPGGGQAGGYVPPGGTITTGPATPQNPTGGTFTLPNTGAGVPITLTTEPTTPTYCGGQPCRGRLLTLSPFGGGYTDARNPPMLDLSLDRSIVQQSGPAWNVWVQKEDPTVAPTKVPDCKTEFWWTKHKIKVKEWKHGWWNHGHWNPGHWDWEWHWKWDLHVQKVAKPSPCVAKRYIDKNGDSHTIVYVLSGDPKFGRR
jgi:uncharacterized repeat protein (TIGR01451 family)